MMVKLCECCEAHGNATILDEVVICGSCGQECSCDGCVVDESAFDISEEELAGRPEPGTGARLAVRKFDEAFARLADA
jgi:hypothetical protein